MGLRRREVDKARAPSLRARPPRPIEPASCADAGRPESLGASSPVTGSASLFTTASSSISAMDGCSPRSASRRGAVRLRGDPRLARRRPRGAVLTGRLTRVAARSPVIALPSGHHVETRPLVIVPAPAPVRATYTVDGTVPSERSRPAAEPSSCPGRRGEGASLCPGREPSAVRTAAYTFGPVATEAWSGPPSTRAPCEARSTRALDSLTGASRWRR